MLKKFFNNFEEILVAPLMLLLTALVFLQVISRFVLQIPMPWVEELLRVSFIWTIMLSASIGIKRKAHLGVSMIMQAMPKYIQAICFYFGILVIITTCAVFIWSTWDILMMQMGSNQRLISVPAPIYISTFALPLGFFLMIVRTIQMTLKIHQTASDYF